MVNLGHPIIELGFLDGLAGPLDDAQVPTDWQTRRDGTNPSEAIGASVRLKGIFCFWIPALEVVTSLQANRRISEVDVTLMPMISLAVPLMIKRWLKEDSTIFTLNITAEAETLKDKIAQEMMSLPFKVLLLAEERLGPILNKVSVLFAWVDMCIQIAIIGRLNLFQIIIRDFFWFVANIASKDFGV
jgi:hypothetical protein